ncbi:MAG: peptide deformylase [bacterium]
MAILPILVYPNPILKKRASQIAKFNEHAKQVISDMEETLKAHKGCVGIAAPQVGESLRIIVVDASGHRKTTTHHGTVILVNPVITSKQGSVTVREGCLSLPDFTGNVTRASNISVKGLGRDGNEIEFETEGFEAVVLQHEIDHLDGYLFIDRVSSMKRDVFRRKKYL